MRKEFNLVEDLLQSSTGTEGQTTEDFLARDERFNNTGNSMEPTETTVQEPQGINSDPKPVYNAHDLLAEIEGTLQKARSDENPNDDLEEVNKTVRSNEEENDLNDTKRGYLMYSEDFLRDEEDKMEASDLKNTIETATAYKIPQVGTFCKEFRNWKTKILARLSWGPRRTRWIDWVCGKIWAGRRANR